MKKSIKYILITIATLCIGAFSASAWHYSSDHRYFSWGDVGQPAKGLLLVNAVSGDHADGEVFVHCKLVNGRYRFYCDEACLVEAIGLGRDNGNWAAGISWFIIYHDSNRQGQACFSMYGGPMNDLKDQASTTSPIDVTEFLYMISNAGVQMGYICPGEGQPSGLKIHICMHNTYVLTKNESKRQLLDFVAGSGDQKICVIDFGRAYANGGLVQYPNFVKFNRSTTDFTGSDSDNALLSIEPDYINGESDSNTYYINFSLGHSASAVEIDNNTSSDSDVAVRVNHNGLFMMQNVSITNSVSGNHGVGVKLSKGENNCNYHNAAVELGNDQSGMGNAVITGQRVGIDAYAGVIRLKRTISNPIHDCTQAISISKGVFLGKWAKDISSFMNNEPVISLKNPSEWSSGDIVFASGRTTVEDQELQPSAQRPSERICPLKDNERQYLKYAPETDLSKMYAISFDNSGITESIDYEYPVFRLYLPDILNPRTGIWYPSLYNALNDSQHPVQDNDELVYYGNITEFKSVTISNDIHIRSAKYGYQPDIDAANGHTISENGYTSFYAGTGENFITVSNGNTVTFGDYVNSSSESVPSGKYTINMDQSGRALNITNGTVNANANFGITSGLVNGTNANGGAVYIHTNGTLNVKDATFMGNDAAGNGKAIYQNGTMTVSGAPVFGSLDSVYLPSGKTIIKAGTLTNTARIPVELANEASGRDILVSANGATDSASGQVVEGDSAKLNVALSEGSLFAVVYNANGFDGAYTPKDVIELFIGSGKITISKTGLKAGESAVFTVTAAGAQSPAYTVVLTGVDGGTVSVNILDVPVNTYTVAETDWSWAYEPVSGTSASIVKSIVESQAEGVYTTYSFENKDKSGTPEHAEDSENNDFRQKDGVSLAGSWFGGATTL